LLETHYVLTYATRGKYTRFISCQLQMTNVCVPEHRLHKVNIASVQNITRVNIVFLSTNRTIVTFFIWQNNY